MNSDNRFDVLAHGLDRLSIDEDLKSKIDRLSELPLDQVFQLKSQVEQELSRFFDLLSESNVDMDTQLITPEGFPRSDIDVLQVRLIRRSVNMLRNDLSKIIERSNSLMAKHFEKLEVKNHVVTQHGAPIESRIPFALVTEVFDSSPSHRGGIQNNDKIIRFGNIHAGNHRKLTAVGNLVRQNEGTEIPMKVLRDGSIVDLALTPLTGWGGRGSLGCKLEEI